MKANGKVVVRNITTVKNLINIMMKPIPLEKLKLCGVRLASKEDECMFGHWS